MQQLSPSSRQAASQAAAGPSQQLKQQQQQQQQQGLDKGAAAAQQEAPKQSEPEKRPQVPQKRPNDSRLQLEQQQQQPPGLKLKKQKREAAQGEQAQLSGGRPSLKVKLGGSSLKVSCSCKAWFYTHPDCSRDTFCQCLSKTCLQVPCVCLHASVCVSCHQEAFVITSAHLQFVITGLFVLLLPHIKAEHVCFVPFHQTQWGA